MLTRRALLLSPLAAAAVVPRPAAELVIDLLPPRPAIKLSQWRGKPVLLEFLLTYCGHCQAASRDIQGIYAEYSQRGVQIAGIAVNDSVGTLIPAFVQTTGVRFPIGMASGLAARQFLQLEQNDPMMMPQLAFIDAQGRIVKQYAGNSEFFHDGFAGRLRAELDALLKLPSSSKTPAGTSPPPPVQIPKKKS